MLLNETSLSLLIKRTRTGVMGTLGSKMDVIMSKVERPAKIDRPSVL